MSQDIGLSCLSCLSRYLYLSDYLSLCQSPPPQPVQREHLSVARACSPTIQLIQRGKFYVVTPSLIVWVCLSSADLTAAISAPNELSLSLYLSLSLSLFLPPSLPPFVDAVAAAFAQKPCRLLLVLLLLLLHFGPTRVLSSYSATERTMSMAMFLSFCCPYPYVLSFFSHIHPSCVYERRDKADMPR